MNKKKIRAIQNEQKITHFKRWKSGKDWLYAASLIAVIGGGGLVVSQTTGVTANADTVVPETSTVSKVNKVTQTSMASSAADSVATPSSATSVASIVSTAGPASTAAIAAVSSSAISTSAIKQVASNTNLKLVADAAPSVTTPTVIPTTIVATNPADFFQSEIKKLLTPHTLTAPNLTSIATTVDNLYNANLSTAIDQVISKTGIENAMNVLSKLVIQAGTTFNAIPGASNALTVADNVIKAAEQGLKVASTFGLDASKVIGPIITNGINLLGKGALTAVTPLLNKVPVVGTGLVNFVKPILSNLASVSPSSVVAALGQATGTSGLLNGIQTITKQVAPAVIKGLQTVLNTAVSLANGAQNFLSNATSGLKSVLAPVQSVINGLITPIKDTLSKVISSINTLPGQPVKTDTGSTTINTSTTNTSSTIATATVQPTIVLKNTTIIQGNRWRPADNFINATASNGTIIPDNLISLTGSVSIEAPGQYVILFQFIDPITEEQVHNTAIVTVKLPTEVLVQQAIQAVQTANIAVNNSQKSVSNLTQQIAQLPQFKSEPTSTLISTTNYPSGDTVYLAAPKQGSFAPNISNIGRYALQYVNDLRTLNGQSTITYSDAEQQFAQQRAQQVVTNFSHNGSNGSTEDLGMNTGITSKMRSDQEIAYYMVMDWYDESDNIEGIGSGHYGHRANLLYGGPSMGMGLAHGTDKSGQQTDYFVFEAPAYTDYALYKKAIDMTNATTAPATTPLPKLDFIYVDSPNFAQLSASLDQAKKQLASDQKALADAQNNLLTA